MRSVFETMGTVASLEFSSDQNILPAVKAAFRDVEAVFSLYLAGSELHQIATGDLDLADASAGLRASYERSNEWRIATAGLFTPHRPDGVLDLNGIVKAEAIECAGLLLDDAGCTDWSINVGGDVLVRTDSDSLAIGVADPSDSGALLASVLLGGNRRALATSGSAQRGDHIWRRGGVHAPSFAQVTVMADSIVTADVLATAIVAGDLRDLDDIVDRWDVDVLTVDRFGNLLATPGFARGLSGRVTEGRGNLSA